MDQLRKLFASLTLRQKVSLAVAVVLVSGGLYSLSNWKHETDFRPLYMGLSPEDAGQVVNRLREDEVEYRLTDGGTVIQVPSAQVAEMRLAMAASGLPRTGRIGYELFDQTNFGATDFTEQVNFHRALEGELERSVMALSEVEKARVHLTLPKDSVFLESRRPAKASVMVQLRPGAELSPQNVQAICYLVSSAVEGLDPETVSLLDMRGNLLNRPRRRGGLETGEPSDALLEYRQSIEKDLLLKIQRTLEPLLGPERFRAGVSVECDFTSGEHSEEVFDPERSVMAASERTEDVVGTAAMTSGIPGTASSLPRPKSASEKAGGGHARRSENLAFQTSRVVRRTRIPQGGVKRMSVALLVDHEVRWEGEGAESRRVVAAPPAEQLDAIRDLVAGAVGLQTERGDQLIVESLPFESTRNWQAPEPAPGDEVRNGLPIPAWLQPYIENQKVLIIGAGAGLAMLLLMLAGAAFMWRRKRRRIRSVSVGHQLPAGSAEAHAAIEEGGDVEAKMQERLAENAALKARMEVEAVKSLKLPPVRTKKAEVLTKHISDEAQKDPTAMAQLVRTWLNEEAE